MATGTGKCKDHKAVMLSQLRRQSNVCLCNLLPWRTEYCWSCSLLSCFHQDCGVCSHRQVVSWWGVLCNSWEGTKLYLSIAKHPIILTLSAGFVLDLENYVERCVFDMCRMTAYSRFGIPPLAGGPQWLSRTRLIKSLLQFNFPLFIWPILGRLPACPGGRPANTCPSKNSSLTVALIRNFQRKSLPNASLSWLYSICTKIDVTQCQLDLDKIFRFSKNL